MILDRFPTRLYWVGGRGVARLNGVELRLVECPQFLPGLVIDAIDYAPDVVSMVMQRFGGWRDMDGEQQAACARHLRKVFGVERRS